MTMRAITTEGLRRSFDGVPAVDGVDLDIPEGEIYGFLGPNGAGKSTTLRILLGLLRADAGAATLLGGDPWRDISGLHRRLNLESVTFRGTTHSIKLSGADARDVRLRDGLA